MFPALDMELEIVRTVLHTDVNDVYVCTDLKKNTGVFYTMVSVKGARYRKLVTEKLNTERLFFSNSDFVGSFVYENRLNLVFRYYHENLLSLMGGVYLLEFTDCKKAAMNLIAAYAQCGADSEMGNLLLQDRNINVTREGEVQFNYFLDFSTLKTEEEKESDLKILAEKVFGILELNYKGKYDSPDNYPDDLRLFYLKMTTTGFNSVGHLISTVRNMADKPAETKGFLPWIKRTFRKMKSFLFRNSIATFLTILVVVTLIYAAGQIYNRWVYKKAFEKNVSYYGIEHIGDVYLGNEE